MAPRSKWLRKRGVLVGAVLVSMAVGSAAIGLWVAYRLPAPEHATDGDLVRWLVTRDLRKESQDTHRALIRRLEQYLSDLDDRDVSAAELNDERRTTLATNVDVLLPEWVAMGSERYETRTASEPPVFLDEQLLLVVRIADFYGVMIQSPSDAVGNDAIFELLDAVERIVATAPSQQQASLASFVRAMKVRWLTTTDLSNLDYDQLVELAARVESELRAGLRLSNVQSNIDPRNGRQLWQNIDLVAEVWFRGQAGIYAALPADKRSAHMKRLVDDVTGWPVIADQLKPATASDLDASNPLSLLMNSRLARAMHQLSQLEERVEIWTLRAPAPVQPQMRTFVSHARTALRIRFLKQFVSGGTSL